MKKVITYGTYDLLHIGHINLLKRAKELGDYLIVGVTSDNFDRIRGKINTQQNLNERVQAVRDTGIADEVIVEEYEGQKIDDIIKYNVDIFTVGSDWVGYFDYLKDYCDVVYLERTLGVSSSQIRANNTIRLGMYGSPLVLEKFSKECSYVNGIEVEAICIDGNNDSVQFDGVHISSDYSEMLEHVDAVYINSAPACHYDQIKQAIDCRKHVICESPITLNGKKTGELFEYARSKGIILMEAIKTAYSIAYQRLIVLIKSGRIGRIVSVDATCTSLRDNKGDGSVPFSPKWNSICSWGPTAMLPVFQFLGSNYKSKKIFSIFDSERDQYDLFTKIDFLYDDAVASIKVGKGIKSEGELVISGTKGYVLVPAPWWKTDYFELRYENSNDNKRYFYQLDGEGIRNEFIEFVRAVHGQQYIERVSRDTSESISYMIEDFYNHKDMESISFD